MVGADTLRPRMQANGEGIVVYGISFMFLLSFFRISILRCISQASILIRVPPKRFPYLQLLRVLEKSSRQHIHQTV